ncbi:hypothetical protein A9Q84_00555 [Halobacteriovorax marinus]|uniref:ABC1 atypical kinase-like domain-containing protein n=1 Tax=Halobacteriovorax marinus TaxID=97084 RepID=A0A1Y5FBP2_9BACT|nr:hypothetical protein A9Q84_00555 [Halobacteriovorax marinus]
MKEDKISNSKTGRLFKIGKTLVKATGAYALEKGKQKAQELTSKIEDGQEYVAQIKAAKELISTMGHLKGGMMKLGQMISITDDLMLPKEVTDLFKVLQKDTSYMPKEDLIKQFQDSFQTSPDELFLEFEYKPIAAASIGQVHKAKLKSGEYVAVKVQYPNIESIVEKDLEQMDTIKKMLEKVIPNMEASDHIIDELKRSLLEECDYIQEAKNIKSFHKNFKDSNEILIPKVFEELSTKTILTMEFMEGDHFEETLDYPQEVRDNLAQTFYDFHFTALCEYRHIHADPQHGNYLFTHDKIIVLDFGATKEFTKDFITRYLSFSKSISTHDLTKFKKHMCEFNFLKDDATDERVEEYFELIHEFYAPFIVEGKQKVQGENPFQSLFNFLNAIKFKDKTVPDENFILLDRANIGVYMKARKWNASVDWLSMINKYQKMYGIE